MAFHELGRVGESQVFRVEPGIYLVRLAGRLTRAVSDALTALVASDDKGDRRCVLYEVSAAFGGYDPELRKLSNQSLLKSGTAHIGIITTNSLLRMVAATVALALRATSGIHMKTYDSVEAAVADARNVMARPR
ncbi:MAG TPA: hypothetical protein VIA18_23770 [Polyangia bacterium]|jgi:hypothetical protein|nr:hypothetical protein [Polyangia bacterium]